jgi:2-succinyl-6-hydroxy-2,4-cyclohexadiene-1-carboxylate synthase
MLHYSVTGKERGAAILFLHGFLGSRADWDEIISGLEPDFRCVAVDLPGHGSSVALPDEDIYTIEGVSAALEALMAGLHLDRCVIVGYSMGGRLALHFALHYPHRCARLVLESASAGLQREVERQERRGMDEALAVRLENRPFDQFLQEWYSQPLFASERYNAQQMDRLMGARLYNQPAELAKSLRGLGAGVQSPLWEKLNSLIVPTLFIAGALDGKYVEVASRFALLGDHVRSAVFPNAGHNVHFEYPAAYTDLLRDFIAAPG